jgi:hypothetical protein
MYMLLYKLMYIFIDMVMDTLRRLGHRRSMGPGSEPDTDMDNDTNTNTDTDDDIDTDLEKDMDTDSGHRHTCRIALQTRQNSLPIS